MTTETLKVGDVLLTRVSYAEIEVEPEQIGLTAVFTFPPGRTWGTLNPPIGIRGRGA